MARAFDDASSEYLQTGTWSNLALPITIACWFYSDDLTIHQRPVSVLDHTNAQYDFISLQLRGNEAGDPVAAQAQLVETFGMSKSGSGYSANTWHHIVGVFASTTSRTVYLDGVAGTEDTTSIASNGYSRTEIGRVSEGDGTSDLQYMSGNVAEFGLWSVVLTATEIAALAAGFWPPMIRPASLHSYSPLIGRLSPEIDRVGGNDLTLFNTPTTAAHPPVIYPERQIFTPPATVAPGDLNIDRSHTNFDNWTRGVAIS
jgi:hypothetical protein